MLAVRSFGTGPPIVALHGFSHTGAQFSDLADRIAHRVVAPDLPGHGMSVDAPSDLPRVVAAVAEVITVVGHGPIPVVGYSQGARIALSTVARWPHIAAALVVISVNPGIRNDSERDRRRASDATLAATIRSEGVDEFLDRWTSTGITSTLHLDPDVRSRDLAARKANTADGLADALTGYGQGVQPPVWDALAAMRVPTLVVAGDRDERYRSLATEIAETMPSAELAIVRASGHNPLLDQPERVADAVSGFLDRYG